MTTAPEPDAPLDVLLRGAEEAATALASRGGHDDGLRHVLWAWINPLRAHGGPDALRAAAAWARAPEAHLRALAADVLGQLNPSLDSLEFAGECTAAVLPLLDDTDPAVLESAIVALGHLYREERPWPVDRVVELARHPDEDVRLACCHALSVGHADRTSAALEALLRLAEDPADDVRDWAVFSLGVQSDVDTPTVREALARRLDDPNEDVRAEAIHGLARRGDERAVVAIEAALATGDVTSPVLEAIVDQPSPRYVDALRGFVESAPDDPLAANALHASEAAG